MGKISLILLLAALASGCASEPARVKNGLTVTVVRKESPVIAELGFADIPGKSGPISFSGGFEHALVLPGSLIAPDSSGIFMGDKDRETVYFAFDHATLSATEKSKLESFIRRIGAAHIESLMIEGHSDDIGSFGYNLQLSEQRAREVRRFVRGLGVPDKRITAVGYSESMPASSNATAEGRAMNRRADLHSTEKGEIR